MHTHTDTHMLHTKVEEQQQKKKNTQNEHGKYNQMRACNKRSYFPLLCFQNVFW